MRRKSLFFGILAIMLILSCNVFAAGTAPQGSGSSEDPWLVETLDNLIWVSTNNYWYHTGKYLIQTADIDASSTSTMNGGLGFLPIGDYNHDFTGYYDGQGHVIENLYINRPSTMYVGLFGYTFAGSISNLGVVNVDITGSNRTGGFIGMNNRTDIDNCFSTGTVTCDTYHCGGFAGYFDGISTQEVIQNCYTRCNIFSTGQRVGGFIGTHDNEVGIYKCYSTGTITGSGSYHGGFCGYNSSDYDLYSRCYWNETTGGATGFGYGGELPAYACDGLTTAQMMEESNYSGWDFDTIWETDDYNNESYPFFGWDWFPAVVEQVETIGEDVQTLVEFNEVNTEIQFSSNHSSVEIDIDMISDKPNIVNELPAGIENIGERFWRVIPDSAPGGTYSITFNLIDIPGVFQFDDLKFLKRDDADSEWQDVEAAPINATLVYNEEDNEVTIQGLSSFSEFVPAGDQDNPLPVTLSSFTASYTNSLPVIQWVTCSEQENSGWNIFRNNDESVNTSVKLNIELIPGAGSTTEINGYSYTDNYEIEGGSLYYYWLESISFNGSAETYGPISLEIPAGEEEEAPEIMESYGLLNSYPNPFNPNVTINFCVDEACEVSIDVYNLKGQRVIELFDGRLENSDTDRVFSLDWNGRDTFGNMAASGRYTLKMKYGNKTDSRRIILLK